MMEVVRKKIFIFYSILLCCIQAFGQDNQIAHDNEQDKKYTPNTNSIFNKLNKRQDQSSSSEINIKNTIKFCPTMLIRQKVMFYYERDLGQGFTLNLGIGKSFGDDVLQKTFLEIRSLASDANTLSAYDMLSNSSFNKSSPFYHFGARYYFSGISYDGGFIDLAYRYENIQYLLSPIINSNAVFGSNDASFRMNAFSFGYGFTALTGQKNNVSHEFYINFGIKYFRYTQYDMVQYQSPYSSSSQQIYQWSPLEQKIRILPAMNIGYCIGFGF